MKKAIQMIHDICSGQKYCTDCPFFDLYADELEETCIVGISPDNCDVDKIVDILERLS